MNLRDYQSAAVRAALEALDAGKRPVVQLPTGSGKSLVGAELCRAMIDRHGGLSAPACTVISITHTRELIRQNADAFRRYVAAVGDPRGSCAAYSAGIYSAGLGEKVLEAQATFAGVQSFCRIQDPPRAQMILIDEAHRCPPEAETQYGMVLDSQRHAALVGLTATPYRLAGGELAEGPWFDAIINPVTTADLQASGYLSPLSGVASRAAVNTAGVRSRSGDFVISELEQVATEPACVDRICRAIAQHAVDRRAILVFAVSIAHTQALADGLNAVGVKAGWLSGNMDADDRDALLQDFQSGAIRALINCMILTTGYDYPGIDCIAVVRPTQSMGLWVQMVGRGLRRTDGKADCQILDFGGNWARHGRSLDGLPPDRVTDEPRIDAEKRLAEAAKNDKTYQFRLANATEGEPVEAAVYGINITVEQNRKNTNLRQLRVAYRTSVGTMLIWLLPEHDQRARWHSQRWFARRGMVMPRSADEAARLARQAEVPLSLSAMLDNGFWRIVVEHFD